MQVVRLSNTAVRNELVTSLQEMLRSRGRPLLQHEASTRLLLQRAVTKNKRQHMLAVFFRGVFAEVRASSAASSCLLGPYAHMPIQLELPHSDYIHHCFLSLYNCSYLFISSSILPFHCQNTSVTPHLKCK